MSHESLVNIDKYREKDIVLIEGKNTQKVQIQQLKQLYLPNEKKLNKVSVRV